MSWLSDAFHDVGNFASTAVNDVGSFWTANQSWLLPTLLGAGALAGGAFLGPALLGGDLLAGGVEAGAEEAGSAFAPEAIAAGEGYNATGGIITSAADVAAGAGGEAVPSAVDITVSPFVEGAAQLPETAGAVESTAASELPGFAGSPAGQFVSSNALSPGGPLDVLGGQSAQDVALSSLAPPGQDLGNVTAFADETEEAVPGETALADVSPAQTIQQDFGVGSDISRGDQPLGQALRQTSAFGEPVPPSETPAFGEPTNVPAASTIDVGPGTYTTGTGATVTPPTGATPLTTAGGPSTAGGGNLADEISTAGGAPLSISDKVGAALGGAGKGLGGFLDNPLVKYGLPLGVMGGLALKGPDKLPAQTQADLALANTEATYGATTLTEAQNGQVSAADQATLDQWEQGQKNQLYQTFASRGGGDPSGNTDYQQALGQIAQQKEAQKQVIINNMITNAFKGFGGASASLQSAANQTVANDASFNQSMSAALQSFGLIAAFSGARGGGGTANAATTTNA
jgi:hypothetical protein